MIKAAFLKLKKGCFCFASRGCEDASATPTQIKQRAWNTAKLEIANERNSAADDSEGATTESHIAMHK